MALDEATTALSVRALEVKTAALAEHPPVVLFLKLLDLSIAIALTALVGLVDAHEQTSFGCECAINDLDVVFDIADDDLRGDKRSKLV